MKREEFLKKGFHSLIGFAAVLPILDACKSTSVEPATTTTGTTTGTGSTNGNSASNCTVTNSETIGPFPTKVPESLIQKDIRSDRTGVAFSFTITIKNANASCAALAGALVDVWHCDKDGYYSEYGGSSLQQTDFTNAHFLRGRQVTDVNGQVSFQSIFPGWYRGRATHIHVHIYNSTGKSLLVTQIAFPEATDSAVVLVNASTANGYSKGMSGYTYNASDNVFSDGVANELGTVTGSISTGFSLTHTIVVSA